MNRFISLVLFIISFFISPVQAEEHPSLVLEGAVMKSYDWPTTTPAVLKCDVREDWCKSTPKETATRLCGWTNTTLAVVDGNVEEVRRLADAGANLQTLDKNGRSLLHLAKASGQKDIVEFLQSRGILENPDVKDKVREKTLLVRGDTIEECKNYWQQDILQQKRRLEEHLISKNRDSLISREIPYTSTTLVNPDKPCDEVTSLTWTARQELKEGENPGFANYYFHLSDSPDWVNLGSFQKIGTAFRGGGMHELGATWLMPRLLLEVHWSNTVYFAMGGTIEEHRMLLLYEGNRIRHVYEVMESGGAANVSRNDK
jgi:hypothetical protein